MLILSYLSCASWDSPNAKSMEVFNIINSKAKGLSTSLLDFHDATLATDLARERPELFIALHLNNNSDSPWYRQLDLGGSSTLGLYAKSFSPDNAKSCEAVLWPDEDPTAA